MHPTPWLSLTSTSASPPPPPLPDADKRRSSVASGGVAVSTAPLFPFRSLSHHAVHHSPRLRSSYLFPRRAVVATAEEDVREESPLPPGGFVEVGYVSNVHGLKGELRVNSTTDFPHLRFCKPGTRWLRALVLGKERIQEVEILSGRQGHKGGWIVSFHGIDSVDQARQIVGSNILIREDDRPELANGEFYSRDLLGMKVVLKESGTLVGTVVNVVNYGSSDLLQVMLDRSDGVLEVSDTPKPNEGARGSLVWIPFVEAIVPDVDMDKREIEITPPKGLLELNLRSDLRSKRERSKLEWKERKKFQQQVNAAKKKLIGMGQKHVLQGFSFGEKEKRSMLANQIVDIDYSLFQYALDNINNRERFNLSEYLETELVRAKSTEIYQKYLTAFPNDEESEHFKLLASGIELLRANRVCMLLVINGGNKQTSGVQGGVDSSGKPISLCHMRESLNAWLLKIREQRIYAPLVIVSPYNDVECYQQLFLENDYFGFDTEKVRFLKEARLPVLANQNHGRMLLTSPWEILQSPVGSGGIFSLLSAHHIIDEIRSWGVDYVQVSGLAEGFTPHSPMLLGTVNSKRSEIGFGISRNRSLDPEDNFDAVLTLEYLNKIVSDPRIVQITAVAGECEHTELVNGEWVNICKAESNCIFLRSSIYSLLNTCDPVAVCIVRTTTD